MIPPASVAAENILLALTPATSSRHFGMARGARRIAEHTAPGFVKGTLSYMAPDPGRQAGEPGQRPFSLAITLWRRWPASACSFHAKFRHDVIEAIRRCEVPAVRRPPARRPAGAVGRSTAHCRRSRGAVRLGRRSDGEREFKRDPGWRGLVEARPTSWFGNRVDEARMARPSCPRPRRRRASELRLASIADVPARW